MMKDCGVFRASTFHVYHDGNVYRESVVHEWLEKVKDAVVSGSISLSDSE
jgi:hypothetical protein